MTTLTESLRRPRPVFYLVMAGLFALIAFAGFTRTYLLPTLTNRFSGPAILHVHAVLFFGWVILLAWQSGLVRQQRIEAHRAWGMVGISLATAMVYTAMVLLVSALDFSVGAATIERTRVLVVVPFSQILLFTAFVAAAVVAVSRPETHRRLMLLATANLLPAPTARLIGVVLGMRPNIGRPNIALVANENLAFTAGLISALAVDLLIVAAIVRDWRARGRPHSAYVVGGACMLAVQLLRKPFAYTPLWHTITDGLLALAR